MRRCKDWLELEMNPRPRSLSDRVGYAFHLAICAACRVYEAQKKILNEQIRKWGQAEQQKPIDSNLVNSSIAEAIKKIS